MAELADALVVANAALGNSPIGKLPPLLCFRSSSHKIFASKSFAGAPCLSILSPALAGYLLVIFSNLILSICGYGGIGRRAGLRILWVTVQVRLLLSAPEEK